MVDTSAVPAQAMMVVQPSTLLAGERTYSHLDGLKHLEFCNYLECIA